MDIEKVYKLYCHKNKTNGKQYFGITKIKPNQRWSNGKGYVKNIHFTRSIQKYGWDGFYHIVMHDGLSKEQAEFLEIEYINKFDTTNRKFGYNISPGGNLISDESTKKRLKSRDGYTHSEETRLKISQSNIGKTHSDETKLQMSITRTGKNVGSQNYKSKPVFQIDKNTGEVLSRYESISLAAKAVGVNQSNIVKVCKGKTKSIGGFRWEYEKNKIA